ncbi:hypothetical protein BH23CHL6_BH23CHL6_06050 [soil metagenome]
MEPNSRRLADVRGGTTQGRPPPPPPPPGPISRVSSSLLMRQPPASPKRLEPMIPFGMPNLRRNVCPHFYVTSPRGPVSIQAPHMLKALMRYDSNISRCQLRGGIHLEQSYVSDMCLSSRFNQCVFYEDELSPR